MKHCGDILASAKTIAVVGLIQQSDSAKLRSFGIHAVPWLRIIPVNPNETEVLGEKAYPSLADVTEPIDIVNVFRRSEFVPEVVKAAVYVKAKCVWLQEGVIHEPAAKEAERAGLLVVRDLCILKEHHRLVRTR